MTRTRRAAVRLAAATVLFLATAVPAAPPVPVQVPAQERVAAQQTPVTAAVGPPRAQRSLLERVIEQEGVQTEIPAPAGRWFGDALTEMLRRITGPLGLLGFRGAGLFARIVLWTLVIVVPLLAIALFVREVARLRRARSPADEVEPEIEATEVSADPSAALLEALAAGQAERALRLLWRFVAQELAERGLPHSDLSLTNRELVAGARRRWPGWSAVSLLEDLARRSDRLLYAGQAPRIDEVRRLVEQAREAVA